MTSVTVSTIATVTANPAIDISASVDEVLPFHKLRCGNEKRDPGGGGINVARVLHRLKANVTAIFPAGGTTGEFLKRLIAREGIPQRAIEIAAETREDITIFETRTGKQYRFVFPGPRLNDGEWHACCDALASLTPRPGIVVASGSLAPGAPADLYARVVRIAKDFGARTVVDTSGLALRAALEEGVYLAKPNLRELSELVGQPLKNEAERLDACRRLIAMGRAEIVMLTLGEQGALAVTREGAWRAHAPPVQVVSTVGAGDSFLSAVIYRLATGSVVAEALRYGVAAGSAALLAPGTELARPTDTESLLGGVTVEEGDGKWTSV